MISSDNAKIQIKSDIREFLLPIIRDVIVLGKNSVIGPQGMLKSMAYLNTQKFSCLKLEDDEIDSILVRESLLLKLPEEKLINYIIRRVKPMMGIGEIMQLDIEVKVTYDDEI